MKKLVYVCGCPGDVNFEVYEKRENEWYKIVKSTKFSYGYRQDHNYEFETIQEPKLLEHPGEYDENRNPGHTGSDNWMRYWVLEGKTVKDYSGWTRRVYVVSSEDEFIDNFINGNRPKSLNEDFDEGFISNFKYKIE